MSTVKLSSPNKKRVTILKPLINFPLPEGPEEPSTNLGDYSFLIAGEPKVGKTTLARHFPSSLFAMFTRGGKGLKIRKVGIPDWETFIRFLSSLKERVKREPDYCRTLIIDTGHDAYESCFDYMLEQFGVTNREDAGFGFWREVDREFQRAQSELEFCGIALVVLVHCDEEEIKKHGMSFHKTTLRMGKQATRFYTGTMDVLAYYCFDELKERWLVIEGDQTKAMGVRADERFLYTDGLAVRAIPMGKNSLEGYKNLVKAFNCELENPDKKGEHANVKRLKLK